MKISFINAVASMCEVRRRQRQSSLPRHRHRLPHRPALPESRHRLRRLLLPERCDGLPRCGPRMRHTTSACSTKSCASTKISATASCAKSAARCGRFAASTSAFSASPSRAALTTFANPPPSLIVQALLQEGCNITAFDPAAMERTQEVMTSGLKFANSAYEAATGADALLDPHRVGGVCQSRSPTPQSGTQISHRDRRPQPV